MKKIKFLSLAFLVSFGFVACEEDSDVFTGNENVGGVLKVKSSVSYVVGNGLDFAYAANITLDNGAVKTTKIEVYKTFTDTKGTATADDDVTSNKVLFRTFSPTSDQHQSMDYTVSYNELIDGLIVDGSPMSTDDGDLNIGDYWTLTYVSTTSAGAKHQVRYQTKIGAGTRFAGTYKCVDGIYYRLGVVTYVTSDWPDETTIESVDATTYRVVKYFGSFTNTSPGGDLYFQVNGDDITYPALKPNGTPQGGNGFPLITCAANPGDMTHVNCGSSDYVVRDNVFGKDQLIMSFGYRPGAPREFYQVMEKIVD